jgi:hypothetical protein
MSKWHDGPPPDGVDGDRLRVLYLAHEHDDPWECIVQWEDRPGGPAWYMYFPDGTCYQFGSFEIDAWKTIGEVE